ncbi:MAG: DUF192 domain-containing protein [Zoogloeaceae bacterium]|jgi:uncharacterized membrane protein (UPF0127 family)|nr:DUF192 domain-containing protein [Zoogloeaceae bacterium]
MKFSFLPAFSALFYLSFPAQAQHLPRVELQASFYRIETEVAATPEQRMTGLMQRRHLGINQGMLFVFPQAEQPCMWMKNTLIPLSVAFIDDEGVIVNIRDMQPQSENNHCAAAPVRYALEMNQGWFSAKGIKPGMKVNGLAGVPSGR